MYYKTQVEKICIHMYITNVVSIGRNIRFQTKQACFSVMIITDQFIKNIFTEFARPVVGSRNHYEYYI